MISAVLATSMLGAPYLARADDAPGSQPSAAGGGSSLGTAPSAPAPTSTNEPTFQAETRPHAWPNRPLLVTGATVFGLSYAPAAVGGALSDANHRKDLYIPIAGPWMMLARGSDQSGGEKTLLIVDGVAQGVGALMLLTSLFIPERKTHHWYLIGANQVTVVPARSGTGYGVGATGRF